jgi:hypothetical protein
MISFEFLLFIIIILIIIYEIIRFNIDNNLYDWKYKPYRLKIYYNSKSINSLYLLKYFNIAIKPTIINDPIYNKIGLIPFDRTNNRIRNMMEYTFDYITSLFESPNSYTHIPSYKYNKRYELDGLITIVLEKPIKYNNIFSKHNYPIYESIIFTDYMTSDNVLDFIRQNLNS